MDKVLKIVFSKTAKSKNLPEALKLAKKLGAVIEDDFVRAGEERAELTEG